MIDLTKNTTAFGLLTEEEKEEFRRTISREETVLQYLGGDNWDEADLISDDYVYRLKPGSETVTVLGNYESQFRGWLFSQVKSDVKTHSITFELNENGEPDCSKPAKVEKL